MAPVTKRAAGEERKIAAPATSSGVPQRPSGVRARIGPTRGVVLQRLRHGRSIQPGAIALTRMSSAAQAIASDFVSCAMPPLLALYAARDPLPKKLSIEAMLTMQPRAWQHGAAAVQDAHRAGEVDVEHLGENLGVVLVAAPNGAGGS